MNAEQIDVSALPNSLPSTRADAAGAFIELRAPAGILFTTGNRVQLSGHCSAAVTTSSRITVLDNAFHPVTRGEGQLLLRPCNDDTGAVFGELPAASATGDRPVLCFCWRSVRTPAAAESVSTPAVPVRSRGFVPAPAWRGCRHRSAGYNGL